jgi:hypothetical protein
MKNRARFSRGAKDEPCLLTCGFYISISVYAALLPLMALLLEQAAHTKWPGMKGRPLKRRITWIVA